MELQSDKSGDYKRVRVSPIPLFYLNFGFFSVPLQLRKAMDLDTPCGVNAIALSSDHTKAALACKDGTLMLWKTDVRYEVICFDCYFLIHAK